MISSGFLHADITHLAFNMIALYSFANVVIGYFGSLFFLVIYLGSLILGNIVTFFFEKNNYSYRAIGASGAVTGIIYSAILLVPFQDVYLFFIPIGIPAYIFGFIYLLYSIYGMKSKSDNIGHTAHFGGAIAGYVFTIAKLPSLLYESTWIVILLGVPIVILFVLAKMKKL
jgi:membrane associated rhomboid family serine protease